MSFFDQFQQNVGSAAKTTADKATELAKATANKAADLAGIAKLELSLSSEKKKLSRLFSALGKAYYEKRESENLSLELEALVREISEQKSVIKNLSDQLAKAKEHIKQ